MFKALFMLKVTGSRSKVTPVSDHDVAQLDHSMNMCAKFELLPAYGYSPDKVVAARLPY